MIKRFRILAFMPVAALLSVFIFLTAWQKQHWDTDIFWALKAGEWISVNMKAPQTDLFSYTFANMPWVDFTWGFQFLAHFFYANVSGWTGLFILQLILTSLIFVFVSINLYLLASRRLWLVSLLLFTVFAGSYLRFFIRPHLFEYLFISLYLLLFNLYETRGRCVYLLLLVPAQIIWINVHSSFVLGLFIAGAYAGGSIIDMARARLGGRVTEPRGVVQYVITAAVLPVVSLINPYGLRLVLFPFVHQGSDKSDALLHISEWSRPHLGGLLLNLYPFPPDHFAFILLFAFVILSLMLNFKSLKSRDVLLVAAAMYMSLSYVRWIQQFPFFAAPVIAANFSVYLNRKEAGWKTYAAAVLLTVFFAASLAHSMLGARARQFMGIGLLNGYYPEGAVAFMKREGVKGNIYNEYFFGGYLISEYPEVKVFIDGRTPTVYSPYFYWTSRVGVSEARWPRLVKEHNLTLALIKTDNPFCNTLYNNREWAVVSFDDVSVLYARRGGENQGLIKKWGFISFNPCELNGGLQLPKDKTGLTAAREELKRLISEAGVGVPRHLRMLALVDIDLGEGYYEEALKELQKVVLLTDDKYINYDLGVVLGRLGRHEEAKARLSRSLSLDKGRADVMLALGEAYYNLKDYKNAVCYLKKSIRVTDDSSSFVAHKTLGMSYYQLSDYPDAADSLKRAAFLTDDGKELGSLYYFIGASMFELGKIDDGRGYFGKAIEANPEYRLVLTKLASSLALGGQAAKASGISSIPQLKEPAIAERQGRAKK